MTSYVAAELRRFVGLRANLLCEYCLIHADDTLLGCQVDHVIAEKHGGLTEANNLCHACTMCNRAKGTDVGSLSATGEFSRFFHPRLDLWTSHFEIEGVFIQPRSIIGQVTTRILGLNAVDRILERTALQEIGRFPSPEAIAYLDQVHH